MIGFGKMLLLAFVSMACIMPHVTMAKANVDSLDDLLDLVGENHEELVARGMEMVSQLSEAAQDFAKRDNPMVTAFLPILMTALTSKSNALLTPEVVKPVIISILKSALGDMYKNVEPYIDTIVNLGLKLLQFILAFAGNALHPTATTAATSVATSHQARDVMQNIYDIIHDGFDR